MIDARTHLCAEHDIPDGEARGFYALGIEVVVVRRSDAFFAYENRCPHRGTTLDWKPNRFMSDDGQWLQCSTHDALFAIDDGACVRGPCVGDRLRALCVERSDGALWLSSR